MTAPSRPLLRYHGGKWRLAPWIISHLPPHRVYVEPFAGAASVLLRKPRSFSELINDLDGAIVELFRVVREQPRELTRLLAWTPFAREAYLESVEPAGDRLEAARRLIARSFMGFGSNAIALNGRTGFRAKAHRNNTTQAHDWASFPRAVKQIARRLRGVVIENRPALEIIAQQDGAATLFYCDPPYVQATRGTRQGYTHEMTEGDHAELLEVLRDVSGMVVLSGYRCELYDRLYGDWRQVERLALADGARERTEVLWLNPAAARALDAADPQMHLFAADGRGKGDW